MSFGVANLLPQEPEKGWLQDRGYLRGPQNRAHRRVLRSCKPSTRREMLFPWRPVENFLVPHAACPHAVMCQSFRKRACLIFGTRTIRGAPTTLLAQVSDFWPDRDLSPGRTADQDTEASLANHMPVSDIS